MHKLDFRECSWGNLKSQFHANQLAKEGWDPQFGARPLKRAVQERILKPLSVKLLEGDFKPGDKIKVTTKGDELVFQKR